jgi:hypothetical protein
MVFTLRTPSWFVAHTSRLLLSLGTTLLCVLAADADWPHLRGTNYDAVATETGLADTWPRDGPPRLWTRALGQGHSGFVVAEGRVYTQRQALGGQYILCLNPENGETIWETRCDWAWQPRGAYPGPYATPTWYRGKIHYASPSGLVGCLDAKTGVEVWSLNLRDKFGGKGYGFGFAATPLVVGDMVIFPAGGANAGLVALDVHDGHTVWTAGSDAGSYCPALPIVFQGRRLIVGYLENALVLVEAANGKLVHRQSLSTGYDEHSAWPIYQEPYLFLAGPFRAPATRLELRPGPDGSITCPLNWSSRELSNDIVSSVLYHGHLYGFDLKQAQASKHRPSRGTFRCVDWATGKTRWSTDDVGQASVLAADGKLLLFSDSGTLILVEANSDKYRELARKQVFEDEICWTPSTLWNGRLLVRSPGHAVCLYVGRSEKLIDAAEASRPNPARSWRTDASWLLGRERDYPNDAFSREEMTLWFAACLAIMATAALATGVIRVVVQRFMKGRFPAALIFWGLTFILGLVSSNPLGTLLDAFFFTWPVSLYAAFSVALLASCRADQQPQQRRRRWLAREAMLGFIAACIGYFEVCKQVGMFVGWYFLFGFVPSFVFAYLAMRARTNNRGFGREVFWTLVGFGAFFWCCEGVLWWRSG